MNFLIWLVLLSLTVFSVAVVFGFVVTKIRQDIVQGGPVLAPETPVRIKAKSGMYRTRFVTQSSAGLHFYSPIARQAYVPLQVGETVTVEAIRKNGVMHFTSTIVERDPETHEFTVATPKTTSVHNRRNSVRRSFESAPVGILVDNSSAVLEDISERGARFRVRNSVKQGERLHVNLPWLASEMGAWVIGTEEVGAGESAACMTRVVFEEPVPLPKRMKKLQLR